MQNGDPRKEVIALGQTYFAIQTRRQELADTFNQLDENNKRLVVRGNIKQWNQLLAEAAHNAGVVTDEEFAIALSDSRENPQRYGGNYKRATQINAFSSVAGLITLNLYLYKLIKDDSPSPRTKLFLSDTFPLYYLVKANKELPDFLTS